MDFSETKPGVVEHEVAPKYETDSTVLCDITSSQQAGNGHLKRRLGNRQIQLIAIGGSIGTATFVSIGAGLSTAGPGGLLLAYAIHSCMVSLINNCMAEMATFMPVNAAFIRMAGHWVDPAWGFLAGWNFFLYEAFNIPFEISAVNVVLSFWRDDIPTAAVVVVCIFLYMTINLLAVKWFAESEFWLATGKVALKLILFSFTFVTMVGGNPKHDAYGFRYWNNPGAFGEYLAPGGLGHLHGFLSALFNAAFTIVGPEYVSMLAGEAKLPRRYLKNAFKTTYFRFTFFFVGSALCVGIVVPFNDPTLTSILQGGNSGAATASPYVIAMQNLGVNGLPNLVAALLITSIFSAGNAYTYYATRSLYGLALERQAPGFLRKCTASGVPVYCLGITMVFPCLAFLNLSAGAAEVLSWFVNLVTTSGLINYIVIATTYLRFYYATQAQGFDRQKLPYHGYFQPYCGYIALIYMAIVVLINGYIVFLPGLWDVKAFITHYAAVALAPILFLAWKVYHGTKLIRSETSDLVWEKPNVDAYEASFDERVAGFWGEIVGMFRVKRPEKPSVAV